jgi:hypothetical protein
VVLDFQALGVADPGDVPTPAACGRYREWAGNVSTAFAEVFRFADASDDLHLRKEPSVFVDVDDEQAAVLDMAVDKRGALPSRGVLKGHRVTIGFATVTDSYDSKALDLPQEGLRIYGWTERIHLAGVVLGPDSSAQGLAGWKSREAVDQPSPFLLC